MVSRRSNAIAETGVAFYSAGGHSHDGENSSIIDAKSYSIFDFSFGRVSTNAARINEQNKNQEAFKNYIISTVNSSVLEPAGVVLQDNIINSRNIIAGSITSDLIAANTITADNIAAGTITADKLDANAISANSITVGADDYWSSNGYFRLGGVNGVSYNGPGSSVAFGSGVTITGNIVSTGTISGGFITGANITASSGSIGGWQIQSNYIWSGTTPGTTLWSNGAIVSGGIFASDQTVIYANGMIVANQFKTATSGARIELGPGVTTADEIYFYDSGGQRVTIRNPGSGVFRISTPGGVYNFANGFSTNENIEVGSISTSTSSTNLVIDASSGYIQFTTKTPSGTRNSYVNGFAIQADYFNASYGSATFPSHTFYDDMDTGMYRSTTNEVRLVGGGGWGIGVQSGVPIVNVATGTGTTLVVDSNARIRALSSKTELKENISIISNALTIIDELEPVEFTFKPFSYDTPAEAEIRQLNKQFGFLAEQVASVSKQIGVDLHESEPAVTVDLESFFSDIDETDPSKVEEQIESIKNSEEYQKAKLQYEKEIKDLDSYVPSYWKHPHMIALCVAGIKELNAKIEALESKIQGV